jgi:hypothetical protein
MYNYHGSLDGTVENEIGCVQLTVIVFLYTGQYYRDCLNPHLNLMSRVRECNHWPTHVVSHPPFPSDSINSNQYCVMGAKDLPKPHIDSSVH